MLLSKVICEKPKNIQTGQIFQSEMDVLLIFLKYLRITFAYIPSYSPSPIFVQFWGGYRCPPYIVLIMLFGPGARLDLWLLSPVPSMRANHGTL